jgi:hypothetical protein
MVIQIQKQIVITLAAGNQRNKLKLKQWLNSIELGQLLVAK